MNGEQRWQRVAAAAEAALAERGPGLHREERELLEMAAAGEGPRLGLEAVVAVVGHRSCDVCVLVQAVSVAEIAAAAVEAGVVAGADVDVFCAAAAEVWLVATLAGIDAGGGAPHGEGLVAAVADAMAVAGCCGRRLRGRAAMLAGLGAVVS